VLFFSAGAVRPFWRVYSASPIYPGAGLRGGKDASMETAFTTSCWGGSGDPWSD